MPSSPPRDATPESKDRKKPKWSSATIHKRRRKAFLRNASTRIVINRSRVRNFIRQQTLQLANAKGDERNKDIYTQDFGKVTRCGANATNLMAQIMEKHIATTMEKLRAHAEHAGRKTVKIRDLKMLNVQS